MNLNTNCAFCCEGECIALSVKKCSASCSFFKTKQQEDESLKSAQARLRSLPIKKQNKIARTYYKIKIPWWA
jgi:hypothetical protein